MRSDEGSCRAPCIEIACRAGLRESAGRPRRVLCREQSVITAEGTPESEPAVQAETQPETQPDLLASERADSAWPSDRDSGLPSDRDSGAHSAQTPESHSAQNRTPPPAHAPPFIRAREPNSLHTTAPAPLPHGFPHPSAEHSVPPQLSRPPQRHASELPLPKAAHHTCPHRRDHPRR